MGLFHKLKVKARRAGFRAKKVSRGYMLLSADGQYGTKCKTVSELEVRIAAVAGGR